jgi:hypothetical protein
MPIIDKLISAYRMEGIDICTGLASHDFGNLPSGPVYPICQGRP